MDLLTIVFLIIAIVAVCGLIVAASIFVNNKKHLQEQNGHLQHLLEMYAADEEEFKEQIEINKKELAALRDQFNKLQEGFDRRGEKINELKEIVAAAEKNKAVGGAQEAHEAALKKQIEDYQNQASELEKQINAYMEEFNAVVQNRDAAKDQVLSLAEEYNNLLREVEKSNGEYNRLQQEVKTVSGQLNDLRASHEAAVLKLAMEERGEGAGWVLAPGPGRETRLITLVAELVDLYPELASDLHNIEWKRVWLPKLQDLCNWEGLSKKSGIYRIRLKDKENICYVGQAVDIKERWYTHVRKMVGVESKGSEKLYEYRPDEVIWEVVEEVDRSRLDERERYWIDWWGCKEIGLNKKK